MEITSKTEHDPVADLIMTDVYMRWALLAAEEVIGKKGLVIVLRDAGLERFIDNYPSEDPTLVSGDITFGDYAAFGANLFGFFGRAGKSMVLRIGRLSTNYSIQQQGELFGIAIAIASRVLPIPTQLEVGLKNMQKGFRTLSQSVGQEIDLHVEDRGDKLAYIDGTCAMCAGKQSTQPMCWLFTGTLQEATRWLTDKEFEVVEVECRAMGAPACVWEISKKPKVE
jgi:predicted hydrocarbon binding protein